MYRNVNGQKVIVPEEVEIGMLVYLAKNGKICLRSKNEYEELEWFQDARNNLAHLTPLDLEAVNRILKRAESI